MKQSDDISLFHIPGYQLIHRGSRCSEHGGLIIYLLDEFTYHLKNVYESSTRWEGLFLDIQHENMKTKAVIGNIYRPPRNNNCNKEVESFLEEFRPVLQKLNKDKTLILLSGDFNLNLLEIADREKIQEYYDSFASNGLYPKITLPTRFARKSCSLIDQIFSKFTDSTKHQISGILFGALSDHFACFTSINVFEKKDFTRPKWTRVYNQTKADIDNFCLELESSIRSTEFINILNHDPNENYDKIERLVCDARQKCMPSKLEKVKRYKHKLSPWITSGILKSIKFRDQLYKAMKLCAPDSQEYTSNRINLNTCNSILQKTIRNAKKSYYRDEFEKHKNDSRKTWCTIKNLINKNKSSKEFPSYFLIDNVKETDTKIIADKFNNFFTSIGPSLANKIKNNNLQNHKSFLLSTITSNFEFHLVDNEHVEKIIQNLKPKASTGHDELSTLLLRRISPFISRILTVTINQSLMTGIFPAHLKIARVLPLYMKDNPYIFDNYRPISLLPSISKVFEKIVYKQVYDYFQTNHLLYESQYGFRSDHSTELASLELCDRIF